jgi:RNase H-like domain found in reverse transcriptase/Reverse transcriptase (RNA-dependent DNA polymerase)/Chromo (CHRromatin Organisation MOdifier) domain/Integrase zinc binding domain/Integrase core domain/Aspartyl protease
MKLGDTKMLVGITVLGTNVEALVDSGATANFLGESFAKQLGIPLREKKDPYRLIVADGNAIDHGDGTVWQETTPLLVQTKGHHGHVIFDITNIGKTKAILGLPWLQETNPHIDWGSLTLSFGNQRYPVQASQRRGVRRTKAFPRGKPSNVEEVICYQLTRSDKASFQIPPEYSEFAELFEEETLQGSLPPHRPWDHEIKIKEGKEPKKFQIYPLSSEKLETLRKYIDENLERGFIQESKSPAGYPAFFVPKGDGGLRLCIDYRQLNEITVNNAYTLPLIQELQDRLQGAKYFTKFDVPRAFHRIRIKEGDEWKTAFRTRLGHFEYLVMPFGLCNAPATWQAYINNVLREHLDVFVFAYMDDILVYSRTLEQHIKDVRKVLQAFRKADLRLEPAKSQFHQQEVKFVGYIIGQNGIATDKEKTQRIREWATPTTVKEVQSFLGFANYYRKFIESYSKISAPMTELTRKDQEFVWNEQAQKAFEELKRRFTEPPVLVFFDENKQSRVDTDASDQALGACLSQQGEDGKWRPVSYHSRKFSSPEIRYSTSDKELLAIVDAMKHWKHYLEGAKHEIIVYSDHKNLTTFTTTKELNRRQLRWSEELASYRFRIMYRKGKENANADALSRRPDYMEKPEKGTAHKLLKQEGPALVHQIAILAKEDLENSLENYEEIKEAQEADANGQLLWKQEAPGMTTEGGIQLFEGRVFLPLSLRQKYIIKAHEPPMEGHKRPEEVLERLQRTYYFPKMRQAVFGQIKRCGLCRKAKYERHKPYGLLQPNQAPEMPWEVISMDFIGPLPPSKDENGVTYERIFVVVDRLTKYARFIPMPANTNAQYLAKVFAREIVARHGTPKAIISDRDPLFTSNFWKSFTGQMQIERKLSTAYHPETDGQTERTNQTLEQYLRLYVDDDQTNWVSLLPTAECSYNNTKQETTGFTPFYSNHGREPGGSGELPWTLPTMATTSLAEMEGLFHQLKSDITFLNARMAMYANKKRVKGPTLKEGDKVYLWRRNIKTKRQSKKLDFLKIGPFRVRSVKGNVNYELALPKGMNMHPIFHISLLEPADQETPLETKAVATDETTQEYEVEKIIDMAVEDGQNKYLIKWKGCPTEENTWEPLMHLGNSSRLLDRFHREHPDLPKPPGPNRQRQLARKGRRGG